MKNFTNSSDIFDYSWCPQRANNKKPTSIKSIVKFLREQIAVESSRWNNYKVLVDRFVENKLFQPKRCYRHGFDRKNQKCMEIVKHCVDWLMDDWIYVVCTLLCTFGFYWQRCSMYRPPLFRAIWSTVLSEILSFNFINSQSISVVQLPGEKAATGVQLSQQLQSNHFNANWWPNKKRQWLLVMTCISKRFHPSVFKSNDNRTAGKAS